MRYRRVGLALVQARLNHVPLADVKNFASSIWCGNIRSGKKKCAPASTPQANRVFVHIAYISAFLRFP